MININIFVFSCSRHGAADNEEYEISILQKAGVLEWSDSEQETHEDSLGKNELKSNRLKFLASINQQSSQHTTQKSLNFNLVSAGHHEGKKI